MKIINENIYIGRALLESDHLVDLCKPLANTFVIITDNTVLPLYGEKLKAHLRAKGLDTHLIAIPSGEDTKTRESKQLIEDKLLALSCGRDTAIIALGGGVITDLAGFVAATYCRGVPVIYIPTTLLAMVDASMGGKTGVNTPQGKNLIGSFTQPQAIVSDLDTLKTLSERDFLTGLAEVIKHALIDDSTYFDFLMTHETSIKNREYKTLLELIAKSCHIKCKFVSEDEREASSRLCLNAGHTIGHALETCCDYNITHGEAVAIGLLVENYMAVRLDLLSQDAFSQIDAMIKRYDIPTKITHPGLTRTALRDAMILDKKSKHSIPHFVLLDAIGKPHHSEHGYAMPVDEAIIQDALDYLLQHFVV